MYAILSFLLLVIFFPCTQSLTVGSNTVVSREGFATFPNSSSTNSILGFASMAAGFSLQDRTTTCTFDSLFSVSRDIGLNGGTLFLRKPLFLGSNAGISSAGLIDGGVNNYEISLSGNANGGSTPGSLLQVAQATGLSEILSASWSFDNTYLAVTTVGTFLGLTEIVVYYFNGTSLTPVITVIVDALLVGVDVNTVRWHPNSYFLAIGQNTGALLNLGSTFLIYQFVLPGLLLIPTALVNQGAAVTALAWDPSGEFIVTGNTGGANQIRLYDFNTLIGPLLGTVTQLDTDTLPGGSGNISINAMSFSPDGQYFCVGDDAGFIHIYHFNGVDTITRTASVNALGGTAVLGAQWNPNYNMRDYIMITQQTNPGVVMYSYSRTTSTLTITDLELKDSVVQDGAWHPSGCSFATTALNSSRQGELDLYSFDSVGGSFNTIQGVETSDSLNDAAWTPNGKYLATVGLAGNTSVWKFADPGYTTFTNATISLNAYTSVAGKWCMNKNCRINGNGNVLDFGQVSSCGKPVGAIQARTGARLIIEDAIIKNVQGNRLSCLMNDGVITCSNCTLELSGAYTFSTGAMIFSGDVHITGSNKFIYSTYNTSTVSSYSTLTFEQGTTFNYAPIIAHKNLLHLSGDTSSLYLNGCTLSATRTGLRLSGGSLFFDNRVTVTSAALFKAEAIEFANDLNITVLAVAKVDLYGHICAS